VLQARLHAQLLGRRSATTPEAVVEHLLAVQAQDARGFRLAIRARSDGLTSADVDAALNRRSLVVSWLNRGTLHLVTAQDYWWLHRLTTPKLATASARRLSQEGVSPIDAEHGIEVVAEAVALGGPQTRAQLRSRLQEAGVPVEGQALVHVLLAATLRGVVVRGPVVGREQAFVDVRDWLGQPPPPLDRDEALARLARRYLVGHGPAADTDLARWAGLPVGDARRGMAAIATQTRTGPDGLVDLADRPTPARAPGQPSPLLGAFDPLLLGWVDREDILGAHHQLVTTNGLFRPTVLVDGHVVGTWGMPGGAVTVDLLDPVRPTAVDAVRADARDVLRFLGLPDRDAEVRPHAAPHRSRAGAR
jgi:Winged helix DNA-binding domain